MDQDSPTMHLTFSAPIQAADTGRRIISGVVVPFGKIGHTNVGAVIFERGSIAIHDGTKIKLLAQHEPTNPIGRAQSFQTTDDAIYGQFKLSASQKGNDYLIMAAEGLIDGLSVGVDVIASKPDHDGVIHVTAAVLKEVSLVETPAFDNAKVLSVAAQMGDMEEAAEEVIEDKEAELIDQISNAVDQLKTLQDVEEALDETQPKTESEASVDETTTAAKPEAIEDRPVIKASQPYITTTVRHGITSKGKYAEHKVKAALGNEESKLWIAAAEDPSNITAAADAMSTNVAFNPTQYLSQFVSNTNFGRPTIDAVGRGVLPASGLTINIPSLVTSAGGGSDTAPTVALTAESAAPSDTGMTSTYESVTVKKYAGQQTISLELMERSDPIFFDQLAIQLERAYLLATDAAMIAVLTAQGTQAATTAGTAAGLISYISTEAPAAYAGSSYFASNIVTNTSWWSTLIGAVDTTGRPIYNAINPYNTAGQSAPTSIKGNVLGLDLYVDKNVTSGLVDESAFIIAPETATWWESPTAYFSVNVVSSMSVNMAIYGYGAGKVLIPAGVRRFNLT
jgi:HK97 family phage prohead protease